MEQLLIQNAQIIDGSGQKPFMGSLSVSGGRITGVYREPLAAIAAQTTLDAGGKTLSPGFVDTHTHSDMLLLHDGAQPSSITQGVTTEIIGQDGLSYAPLSLANLQAYALYLKGLDGLFPDVALDFETTEQYLAKFKGKTAVNVAYLVPHCALRLETVGFADRMLTQDQMQVAGNLLRQGMREGAKGLSTGLSYFPGSFCDTEELVDFCKVLAQEDGVYVTHLRTVFRDKPFDNVEEAIEIAKRSGAKLHFSHFRVSVQTLGRVPFLMEKIDRAIAEGVDITLELYPYIYGASYAPMLLPMWANDGGMQAVMRRLADPADRQKIAAYIDSEFAQMDGMIAYAGEDSRLEGQVFSDIAQSCGKTKGEAIAELLHTQELALGFHEIEPQLSEADTLQFEKDIFELLSRPCYMVGSDAIHLGAYPHPRGWGSYAKLLRMAHEHNFPLEALINRMTYLPCERFKIRDRGLLKEGYHADMVLFEPAAVREKATVAHPRRQAEGMHHVWVNGAMALKAGVPTSALPGICV